MRRFVDRCEAGRELAGLLHSFAHDARVVVLGLTPGGIVVAREIAEALDVPLDVLAVRRLSVGGNIDLSLGAIGVNGPTTINWSTADKLRLGDIAIEALVTRERNTLQQTDRQYRSVRPALDVEGRTVILVDDGVASGATMTTAIASVRALRPARIIATAPVASCDAERLIRQHADATVFAYTPPRLYDIDLWYEDFRAVSDADAMKLLRGDASRRVASTGHAAGA
jgi:putative phosphoribosyl transferase